MKTIPYQAPHHDSEGAYAYVVLARWSCSDHETPRSVHRELDQAEMVAEAHGGRVMRLSYYDSIPRDVEEMPQ